MSNDIRPIVTDAHTRRGHLRDKTVEGLHSLFPLVARDQDLHVENIRVKPAVYSSNDQKAAILHGRTLAEPVVGDLILKDKAGNVLDTKKGHILAHLPYFTERHSMIVGGNEYEVPSQLRLKPGVYTRERGNGEFEAAFNLSKGDNFRVSMEPETGKLKAEFGSTTIPLRPMLKAMGLTDATLKKQWGAELFEANLSQRGTTDAAALNKLVARLKRPKDAIDDPHAFLARYFDETRMDPNVTQRTLGRGFDRVTGEAVLAASKKLVRVHRGDDEQDDRDSLEFKTIHTIDDFFKERLEKEAKRTVAPKLVWKINQGKGKTIKEMVPSSTFTRPLNSFLTTSAIAAIPTQYNPAALIDSASKITSLGEGGIGNDRAIPFEARRIHSTHYGVLDPVRTPECFDDQTEVFTARGWVPWPAVQDDDLFACRIDGRLEFHAAQRVVRARYIGDLIAIRNAQLDVNVTPTHRMYSRPRRKGALYAFENADVFSEKTRCITSRHAPYSSDVTTYTVPALTVYRKDKAWKTFPERTFAVDDWAAFLGWYVAEGHTVQQARPARYHVCIAQSSTASPTECAEISALLQRMGLKHCRGVNTFTVCSKQLVLALPQGRSYQKTLPEYVYTFPVSARQALLDALLAGDGHVLPGKNGKYHTQRFYTSSPQLAEDVARLAATLGLPVHRYRKAGAKAHHQPVHTVAFLQQHETYFRGNAARIAYDGFVYCATVPGSLLYTRRSAGIPIWSGNSSHAGIDIRAAMGASKDNLGNLYGHFKDARTGHTTAVPVTTLARSTVAFTGQEKRKGHVDALRGHDVVSVPRSEVDYYLTDPTHQFSPTTALVPFLDGSQGNRLLMSSKFQTQSLPLLERDVPYVQAMAPRNGESMTKEIARLIVPTSKHHGVIAKIDKDYIYIRPDAAKHGAERKTPKLKLKRAPGAALRGAVNTVEYLAKHPEEYEWVFEDSHTKEASFEDYADDETLQVPAYLAEHSTEKTAAAKKPADDDGLIKLPYDTNFPLAAKTYLHNTVKVKEGDRVTPGQLLADSNFTKDDHVALGKNMVVGYLAYYGKNSNDAVVISEGAAKKLTSEHMYKETLRKGPDTIQDKAKYLTYYGMRFTKAQLDKLDEHGLPKPGVHLDYGDPVMLALEKAAPSPDAQMLGHLHKSLVKPYRDAAILWEHHVPGEVVEVVNASRQAVATVRTREPMKIGDKLANRFGGKGVVSEIVSDHRMVQDASGKPIDILFTSAGIVSRINPAQVVEAALGKVVEKTGKPYVLPQFMDQNNVDFAKAELKKHKIEDKETVFDPVSGRSIPKVFVGRSYIHKLFKNTETNYAARGVSSYDVNLQPTKGGDEGAKGLGKMEINTLLAHNARSVLRDAVTIKSEKSDDYWRAMEFGLPPPPPKSPFVTDKFQSMIQGAGISLDKRGTNIALGALTDKHVMDMSAGALTLPELEKSKSFMVTAKDLKPEKGGLFDPVLTGGMSGTKWSHIELPEPMLNPVFEDPARRLLGYTRAQMRDHVGEHGGTHLKKKLNAIDLDATEKALLRTTHTARGAKLDDAVKQLKYVRALKDAGHKGAGDAYVVSKIPVIPPVMRPILPSQRNGELQISDANYLYRDLALAASGLKAVSATGLPELTRDARTHLYDASAALAGIGDPVSPQLQGRGVKGFISQISGQGSPKQGFLFKKVLKRQQDLSMRGTATPDNTLDMDQIGVPEEMLWKTYDKFVMKGLIGQGYSATAAKTMIEERHPAARAVLQHELRTRPIFVNRAPSLHKHNMVAAFPVAVAGQSLRINPFMEKGQNLDYDGDTMQLHVPVSPQAVAEARELTLSKLLFSDKSRDDLMIFPQHEAIIGAYLATSKTPTGMAKKFKTKADAMAAYKRGEITLETKVSIG